MKSPSKHQTRRRLLKELADPEPPQVVLGEWFDSALGAAVLEAERAMLAPLLSRLFGYHILQIGCSCSHSLINDSPVGHKILFSPVFDAANGLPVADNEELPLARDSVDVVLIHHALDFTRDSHQLLREATRVLRPGGHILVIGFNPLSPWGLSKALRFRPDIPWNGRFISSRRVADWLKLLELHVEKVEFGLHFLPSGWGRVLDSAPRAEQLGRKLRSPFGGVYVMLGVKRVLPITPLLPRWRPIRPPAGIIPATENVRIKKLH